MERGLEDLHLHEMRRDQTTGLAQLKPARCTAVAAIAAAAAAAAVVRPRAVNVGSSKRNHDGRWWTEATTAGQINCSAHPTCSRARR
ncbi:hypothetical protein LIPSTDRAFT_68906 [Lipomyces starkeyi NRRL Y-11557]|uniref:Uncharacterized protein n=1 Tax=Lipomyces starkeyi NRRL Y-11557 TaxID=675824 RepID=A0A1E3QAR3_LIPST|nr:hypothetical protein LIPSTDRAFT_68906 [Lipomyces starkeyi NRRL Y-11557]